MFVIFCPLMMHLNLFESTTNKEITGSKFFLFYLSESIFNIRNYTDNGVIKKRISLIRNINADNDIFNSCDFS